MMKTKLLKLALCAFVSALPLGAWADSSWSFGDSFTDADNTNLTAGVTAGDWVKDGTNNRYGYLKALSNEALTANSTALAYTSGLKFTAAAPSGTAYADTKVRVSAADKAIWIGKDATVTIPNCTAGQVIRAFIKTSNSSGVSSTTNLTQLSDFSSLTNTFAYYLGVVSTDGDVSITLTSNTYMLIRTLEVITPGKSFDEAATYSGGGSNVNVLMKRSIKKNYWNALCLPFTMSEAKTKEVLGDNVELAQYTSYTSGALGFTKMATPSVTAHTPYLVKTDKDFTYLWITSVSPSSSSNPGSSNWVTPTSAEYTFKGIYSPATPGTDDVFLGRNNTLYKGNGTNSIKGFRAYFSPVATGAHELYITIDGEEATNIIGIETESHSTLNGVVYNLQGQKVANSVNGLSNGVYIVKGKKIVIK